MDALDLEPGAHRRALDGLARLNRWSFAARLLSKPVLSMEGNCHPLRVLDVACGGGDVTVGLARLADERAFVDGCDLSPRAVEIATARARRANVPSTFFASDVIRDPLPESYDVLVCSLFLHHLEAAEVTDLLRRMAHAARVGIVVGDLERGWPGFLLAAIATRVLTRCPVVRTDALLSVRAAFSREELRKLADDADLEAASLEPCWPWRQRLVWRRP
jgi:2-polyprenyl-3-methyl-5-hydroxy-6-metoxy-1,4-benzoquinol methylase